MTRHPTTSDIGLDAIFPTVFIGLGTTGTQTSSMARHRSVEHLLDLARLGGAERERVREPLLKLYPALSLDSDNRRRVQLQPAFHGEEPEASEAPPAYRPLATPGGHDILEGLDTPPYRHMKEFAEANRELLEEKSANAEAQSSRLYGVANAYADILRLDNAITEVLFRARNLPNESAWSELRGRGFPLSAETTVVNIVGSGAGGQATALFVVALVLVNLRLPLARSAFKIVVDFMNPGFLQSQSANVATDQRVKSLRVVEDLAELKCGGAVEVPHPNGALRFGGIRARDVFDEFYLHLPWPTGGDAFACFVSSVASLVVDRSLSPYSDDWQTSSANDPYLATVPALA